MTEGVHFAAAPQHQAVMAARRHRDSSHASQPFDDLRRELLGQVAVPEQAVSTVAKRVDEPIDAQHEA
eukprot:7387680-Prymnesium_polylepis.1